MKYGTILFPTVCALALLAAPQVARADAHPDFDDDATPILRMQPGLIDYVHSRFEVKDTGTAKYPGDDDHAPQPPFIFRARPIGSEGPFNLRLLIQPGPPGHILGVVDITKAHLASSGAPSTRVASQSVPAAPQKQPAAQAPAPQAPAQSAASSSEPTADTPSGPIKEDSQAPSSQSSPSLAPPPDPAPPAQ